MTSTSQPTAESLTAIAKTYISIFATLDADILKPIQSDSYTHVFAPVSAGMSVTLDSDQFNAHLTHMRGIMSAFPVHAKQIWPNPTLKQVTIWAESETKFLNHVKDNDSDEWTYRGEYMFVLTMDQSGEKITHVLEFLDSKGTERVRGLIARAWKKKAEVDASLKS